MINYDLVFGVIIGISAIIGLMRGAVSELLSYSTWILSILFAKQFHVYITNFIPINNEWIRYSIGISVIFIVIAIIVNVVKKILYKGVNTLGLTGVDYLIGGVFGVLRGLIVCAVCGMILTNTTNQHWHQSLFDPYISDTVVFIQKLIPNRLQIKSTTHQ